MTGTQLRERLRGLGIEVVGVDGMTTDVSRRHPFIWHLRASATTLTPRQIVDLSSWLPRCVRLDVETEEYAGRPDYVDRQRGYKGASYGERRVVSVVGESSEPLTETQGLLLDEAMMPRVERVRPETVPARSQGYRADLWGRIQAHFSLSRRYDFETTAHPMTALEGITIIDNVGIHASGYQWGWGTCDRAACSPRQRQDILARWAVYQELKPLYDVVDGVSSGPVAMPRDVEVEWNRRIGQGSSVDDDWRALRDGDVIVAQRQRGTFAEGRPATIFQQQFPSILDAVAEARIAARSQQPQLTTTPAPILRRFDAAALRQAISSDYDIVAVTPLRQPQEPNRGRYLVEVRLLSERGYRCSTNLPRGITVRYDISDGGTRGAEVPGVRDDLVADLDDSPVLRWPSQLDKLRRCLHAEGIAVVSLRLFTDAELRDLQLAAICAAERGPALWHRLELRPHRSHGPADAARITAQLPRNLQVFWSGGAFSAPQRPGGTDETFSHPLQGEFKDAADEIIRITTGYVSTPVLKQPRRVDLDEIKRRLGGVDATMVVTGFTLGRSDKFDFNIRATTASGTLQTDALAPLLPRKIRLRLVRAGDTSSSNYVGHVDGIADEVFVPSPVAATAQTPAPSPRYFDVDGDTASTPEKAPAWLQQFCVEVRAQKATWRRGGNSIEICFHLPFGHPFPAGRKAFLVGKATDETGFGTTISLTSINGPPPRVPICMVRQIRSDRDLAVLDCPADEADVVREWAAMPDLLYRNVVVDIVENGCPGLDDVAVALRASQFADLIAEAKRLKVEVADHVQRWCRQFHNRWNLLDLDDDVRPTSLPQQTLKRGKKLVTITMVQKFRERWGSRDKPTAAEVAKVAGFEGNEVALHVLVNHCGGLGDEEALALLGKAGGQPHPGTQEIAIADVDAAAKQHRPAPLLDPDPTADPTSVVTAWRERQRRDEAEAATRRRVAEMRARTQQATTTTRTVPPRRQCLVEVVDVSAVPAGWQQLIVAGACLVAADEVTAN